MRSARLDTALRLTHEEFYGAIESAIQSLDARHTSRYNTPRSILPDGVTAARLTLDQLVQVRILVRQLPNYLQNAGLSKGPAAEPGLFTATVLQPEYSEA